MYKKSFYLLVIAFSLTVYFCFAQQTQVTKDTSSEENQLINSLLGTLEIDLKPSPEAASYLKEFRISKYEEGILSGSFYDTPFKNGRINTAWGKVHFAFTTADNSGTYYHSGYLENNKLFGNSFSPARGFIMPWSGVKKK